MGTADAEAGERMADAKQGAREKRLREGGGSGIGSGDDEAETGGKLSAAASAMAEGPTAADGVVMHDPNKFVAAACVLRLVVLPAICLPLHLLLRQMGALSADPIVLMILTISAGTPSSQTLVMYFNARGATRLATESAKIYVPMYALSVLTVSVLIVTVCLIVGTVDGTKMASPSVRNLVHVLQALRDSTNRTPEGSLVFPTDRWCSCYLSQ